MEKTVKIKKGHHYSNEWPKPLFFCKGYERSETRTYTFDESCRYDIGEDQSDKNKLFGWGYGFHQRNSVRVSWWYNPQTDKIDIGLYSYVDGKVAKRIINDVSIGQPIKIMLEVTTCGDRTCAKLTTNDHFCVYQELSTKLPKWGYTLTTYFGGNKTAPHDMTVKYTKEDY